MLSGNILNGSTGSWTVSSQLHNISIHISGDHPDIHPYIDEFLTLMVGRDGHPPRDRLEFFLSLSEEEPSRPTPSGTESLVQFVNVSCFLQGSTVSFHTKDGSWLEMDIRAGRVWGQLSRRLLEVPRYVFTDLMLAPLMEMLKHRGYFGLHAAALARDGSGYLFPGGVGSGKTTVALSLVRQGFHYLADDKVLLTKEQTQINALAFTRRFNIDPDIGMHYPELRFLEGLQPLPGSSKRPLDISRVYADSFIFSLEPKYLIHLERSSSLKSRIVPLSPHESFIRLVQQTVPAFAREVVEEQLSFFAALARQTEGHLLYNCEDLLEDPEHLLELLPHGKTPR
jgi:hypothetical protein